MKYCFSLLLVGLLFACNDSGNNGDPSNSQADSDSIQNGIVEYELNEDRISAVEYSNELSLIQQHVYDQINVLFLSGPSTIKQNYDNAIFDISLKAKDVENMPNYEGGTAFKTAILNLLEFYKSELKDGFAKMLPLLEKPAEERTKDEEYRIIDYDEQFAIKEADFFKVISEEQDKFAAENNFKTQAL